LRICSLLPSATEIIADLGFVDSLVGVSAECRWPPEVVGKPVVSTAAIDPAALSSLEIEEAVRDAIAGGASLYAVDAELIDELRPDLIVTQDLCAVCAVSSDHLVNACPAGAEVLSLDPRTLDEVAASVLTLAARLGVPERGDELVSRFRQAIDEVRDAVAGRAPRRVFVAEWLDPPYCAGHWLPEMIELAGGDDPLAAKGRPSHPVTWERVLAGEPELVIAAPCGFDAPQAAERAADLPLDVPVVAVDGDAYYSRPALRLADGVRQLGHLLHPDAVPDPGLPAIEPVRLGRG
jgi:iron complex transport system substrate-binding protein